MATLLMFATARVASGLSRAQFEAETLEDLLAMAQATYGEGFASVLLSSRIWVNGHDAIGSTVLTDSDEVAVIPPVAGG